MQIAIIRMINVVIEKVGVMLTALLAALPDSPFLFDQDIDVTWVSYINYFFPVDDVLVHLTLFVTAVAIYYVLRIALRWAKAID